MQNRNDFFALSTPRLQLRRMQEADVTRFAAYRANAELARFQGWSPMSLEAAASFVEEMRLAPALVPESWIQLAIAELPEGLIVGDIGLCLHADGDLEVGFTIRPESQGRGFATEAMVALARAVADGAVAPRIVGVVDARNAASIRVLEKIGMKRVSSEQTLFKNEPCTELRYELDVAA